MGSRTIRNLDHARKRPLRVGAAEQAREIRRQAVVAPPAGNLGEAIRDRFTTIAGAKPELPPRDAMRAPPSFE